MDNLTHTLVGWWLAKTRLGSRSPLSGVALIVAANLADVDVVVRVLGDNAAYLDHHRGFTHGVLGLALQVLLLTWVMKALERRGGRDGSPGPFLAVLIGVASHPLLDLLNVYGIRPWLPFDHTWYYGDLVFIVDPWLWLWLAVGVALTGRRTRGEDRALLLVALVTCGVVYGVGRTRLPAALLIAWLPALIALAWLRLRGGWARCPRRTLAASALLVLAHLTLLGLGREASKTHAMPALRAAVPAGGHLTAVAPLPELARPLTWTWLADTGDALLWQPVDRGQLGPLRVAAKNTAHPAVIAASATREGQVWQRFARFPIADVRPTDAGVDVHLTDGRFFYTDFCTLTVRVP